VDTDLANGGQANRTTFPKNHQKKTDNPSFKKLSGLLSGKIDGFKSTLSDKPDNWKISDYLISLILCENPD
jgi:hypothetical protein